MFWARSKGLRPLTDSTLSFEDFPKEPIQQSDGTILHALERCYPLVTRSVGFYTARIINISLVPLIYNNLIYYFLILPQKTRVWITIKNKIKQKLSNYPFIYTFTKTILRKITSY